MVASLLVVCLMVCLLSSSGPPGLPFDPDTWKDGGGAAFRLRGRWIPPDWRRMCSVPAKPPSSAGDRPPRGRQEDSDAPHHRRIALLAVVAFAAGAVAAPAKSPVKRLGKTVVQHQDETVKAVLSWRYANQTFEKEPWLLLELAFRRREGRPST